MYRTDLKIINATRAESNGLPVQRFFAEVNYTVPFVDVWDPRFTVKIAETAEEREAVLRLRYKVFKVEMGKEMPNPFGMEQDEFDSTSHHLIAVEKISNKVVGVYRLRTSELLCEGLGFYSAQEFDLSGLPPDVLNESVEIGRACIDSAYRNTKVLFLLWKGLANYVLKMKKRYLFGCCSLFSQNPEDGISAFLKLKRNNALHERFGVLPKNSELSAPEDFSSLNSTADIELPKLFTSYLRIGAKVCSPPVIDRDFGTIDFFVIFDVEKIEERYYRMFFTSSESLETTTAAA